MAIAACSDDASQDLNNVTVVTPTSPMGYVAGLVTHAADGTAMSGARVVLFGGGNAGETTTDNNGQFSFGPISAGASFSLRIDKDGFADATLTNLTIDDAAGNFPTANGSLFAGPIALIPIGGTHVVQVVDGEGSPVQNASVIFEVSPRYVYNNLVGGAFEARVTTDVDGLAKTSALPDVRLLPPRYAARMTINVAPIDRNGDGAAELRGETLILDDAALREGGGTPVIVLYEGNAAPLRIVSSNLGTLIDRGAAAFPVIEGTESIRVVFNKAVDRDSVTVDLRDENGAVSIPAPHVVSASGTIITIDPAEDLLQGREYNLALSVSSARDGLREMFIAATPFFARVDPNVMIAMTGRFRDVNGDAAWGNDGDVLELTASIPIGRARMSGGNANLWIALDFNGTGILGDQQGELPPSGQPYPSPLVIALGEPNPGNGAGVSGFTRFFAGLPIGLPTPIGSAAGGAAFEVRIEEQPLSDISGRPAPARTTGTALLQ